jgi:hypothetical protein
VQPTRIHRRRLRHFVCLALFAWVFALTAGVANACIVALPGLALAGSPVDSDHEHDPGVAHGDPGKDGCSKVCDDETSAQSKNRSAGFDNMHAHVGGHGRRSQAVSVAHDAGRLWPERSSAQGPPLVIRLLRLTL